MSDRRRTARQGKLVLPNLDGMGFVSVEMEESAALAEPFSDVFFEDQERVGSDPAIEILGHFLELGSKSLKRRSRQSVR